MAVLAGAEPFRHEGGPVGVLLVHGYTGCPQSLRPWAEQLAAAGYSVELPLLPGHGTTWQEMNRTRWSDWLAAAEAALADLRARCAVVVVAGLSMGGALALRLAQLHPDDVAGLVLVNAAVKLEHPLLPLAGVIKGLLPSFPGIASDIKKPGATELAYTRNPLRALHSFLQGQAEVRADLGRVTQPVLLFRSRVDHVVPASSSALIMSGVASADVAEIVLEDSYHVATLDHDAPRIFTESEAFVARLAAATEGAR